MRITSLRFSHQVVAKRRKGRPDKAREGTRLRVGPRKRTVGDVEEAGGTRLRVVQRSKAGSYRRCSRGGVRNAGYRGFFLFFFATLAFSIPLRGDHFFLRVPQNHFFPPSRTLFFFRPELYVRSHLHSTPLIYAPPLHSGRYHKSVTDGHSAASPKIYFLAVVGPIDAEIVRANTTDLIFQVHPEKALVYIDGMLIGSARDFATQRDRYTILEGQHDLRIEAPGYEPYQTEMKIMANRTLNLDIELEPLGKGSDGK